MAVVPMQEFETANCKAPLCTNEAKTTRGVYAYLCEEHAREKRIAGGTTSTRSNGASEDGELVAGLKSLNALAKKADKLEAKAQQLRKQADDIAWQAGEARDAFKARLRELTGGA